MNQQRMQVFGVAFLAGVLLLVGFAVGFAQVSGDGWVRGPQWLWWLIYGVFLVAFFGTFLMDKLPRWPLIGLSITVVSAAALVGLAPQSWTPILLVITTANAAYVVGVRGTIAVGAINTAVLVGSSMSHGAPLGEAVMGAAMYAGLQALTAWSVWLQEREVESRKRISTIHTDLKATSALLAESTRSSERLRISRDLHDVIGHQLTALALELEVAAHKSAPPASDHVARARALAKDLLSDVRSAVGELRDRPADLRDALTAVVEDLPAPTIHLNADEVSVDGERIATLVRCVQEIVTNTIKHTEAWNLWVSVSAEPDGEIVLQARDDGPGAPALKLGNGLTGMRERVSQHEGTITFDSRNGFRVEVRLPAPPSASPLVAHAPAHADGTTADAPTVDAPTADADGTTADAPTAGSRDTAEAANTSNAEDASTTTTSTLSAERA